VSPTRDPVFAYIGDVFQPRRDTDLLKAHVAEMLALLEDIADRLDQGHTIEPDGFIGVDVIEFVKRIRSQQ
jgi:hypothetical protein